MSLACRTADAVNCGLGATGPQPFAARVALIWSSSAPPSSPASAWAGTAVSITATAVIDAAQNGRSVDIFPRLITRAPLVSVPDRSQYGHDRVAVSGI